MTWTYSGDPAANARDAVRFLVGDTDTNDQLVTDEEIAWTNNQVTGSDTATTDLYTVAYRVMVTIASKFSRLADQTIGDMSVSMSQKADNARAQADQLRALAGRENLVPVPYAGGISVADKDVDRNNADRVDPFFTSGQFANTYDNGSGPARAYAGEDDDTLS